MQTEYLEKAIEMGVKTALQNMEVARVKEVVDDAIEDGLAIAKRTVKRSRRNAEEMIDAATCNVKRHPLLAVGVTFGVGIGLGALVGILTSRNNRC
ncbi:MAG TPA: hypothetical protein VJ302_38160 [Blastocatellia bacterium]|nr:hypothetical protein [Blastocatellia bacterium]